MKFIVLVLLVGAAMSAEIGMNQAGDSYNFHYSAGDAGGHARSESGHGGTVVGSYRYIDPNGNLRQVSYTAGADGFKPTGDIGVDEVTKRKAAEVAALAPKAPVPAPAHHAAPYYHGAYYGPYYHHGAAWAHHAAPHYAQWAAHW